MRQMALRIFFYIWGAIVGTVAVVLAVAITLDLPPPGTMPVSIIKALAAEATRLPIETGGQAELTRFLASRPELAQHFQITPAASPLCADASMIVTRVRGDCLVLVVPPDTAHLFVRVFPFVIPLSVGLVISAIVALALARRFIGPIRRIGEGLGNLSRGQLDHRIGNSLDQAEPALRDISHAFDAAAEELQVLTSGRTRLFHDLSHEIRSPLARLKAALALLERNPARQAAILPRMNADIERMDRLVGEVLTLARFEHLGPDKIRTAPHDLVELLDLILRDAAFEGQSRGIKISYAGPDNLVIHCDAELLHRAFENILRNALRYSPADSRIWVDLTQKDDWIHVSFRDEGPGFRPAEGGEMADMFSPFIRAQNSTGTGLGLTIAKHALQAHGGRISAQNAAAGSGLCVLCELPSGLGKSA